jgi:hypothetical protein
MKFEDIRNLRDLGPFLDSLDVEDLPYPIEFTEIHARKVMSEETVDRIMGRDGAYPSSIAQYRWYTTNNEVLGKWRHHYDNNGGSYVCLRIHIKED